MRTLIVHNRYREHGGEDRHVDLLERGLSSAGVEVRRFEVDSASLEHSRARRVRAGALLAYDPAAGGLDRELEAWRPDVVHVHNLWPLLTPAALRHARRAGARVVVTAHNCRFACPGGTCPSRVGRDEGVLENRCLAGSSLRCAIVNDPRGARAESLAYGFALELQRRLGMLRRWVDVFISPSRYVAAMLAHVGIPPARIARIPNGVEVGDSRPPGSEFALYAGRLDEVKGTGTLLRAAQTTRAPIAVAGAGALEPEVRRAGVRYLGELDRDQLAGAMDRAAFTIVPSECRENWPYAVAESFAAGRPTIASRTGGLVELVQDRDTGLLVAPGNPGELSIAIDRLWSDPDLCARLGRRAHEVAVEELRFETQIERTVALYSSLIAR